MKNYPLRVDSVFAIDDRILQRIATGLDDVGRREPLRMASYPLVKMGWLLAYAIRYM
jgi:hypothetical protein